MHRTTFPLPLAILSCIALPALAEEITPADLTNLPAADVVVLGETHDNPTHHDNQVAAVRALNPSALVFEMITPEAAPGAPLTSSDPVELAKLFSPGWEAGFYVPILLAAAPGTPVYGAEVPRAEVRRAMAEGVGAVFGPEAGAYGLDRPLAAEDQAGREEDQLTAHCNAMPAEMLAPLVEGQRLRDASLARAVVAARTAAEAAVGAAAGSGAAGAAPQAPGPVVVITGSGHARKDRGMPVYLAEVAPGLRLLSIGQIEGAPQPDAPYDLWLRTPPVADREDPCAAFGATAAPAAAPTAGSE